MASGSVGFFNRSFSRMVRALPFALLVLAPLMGQGAGGPPANMQHYLETGQLNFLDQTTCFTAIEKVYYNHRIWPSQNPTPKPTFDEMSAATNFPKIIGDAVRGFNDKERLLLKRTGMPTVEQIQGEVNRIVKQTQDPVMLIQMYTAVSNDPQLFAACIAEPALVNRLYLEAQASGVLTSNATAPSPPVGTQPSYIVPPIATANCAAWSPVRSGAPRARFGQGENLPAVWTGSEMIVWGGNSGGGAINTGGRYNPALDDWLPTPTALPAPSARFNHTVVWTGSEMIVWGGSAATRFDTGGRYNPVSNTWVATTQISAPTPREFHTAVWTGSEMIIWGGQTALQDGVASGARYNPTNDSWTMTSSGTNLPAGRYKHTAVWTGSEMIVWGGNATGVAVNTGGRYNPVMDSWVATSTVSAPTGRYFHTAVWAGDKDPFGNPIACPSGCPNKMIIWGGSNSEQTGGVYDPSTGAGTWTATSTGTNLPAGRLFHSAVWTGSEMLIWGGQGTSSFFNTGSRYNPIANSWTPISGAANISGRWLHTAVWDIVHQKMIVWGGQNVGFLNTGGRYDPASDSWITTYSGDNVPSARSDHTATWTGSEMIVWGGNTSSSTAITHTNGKYMPVLNDWVPTCNNLPGGIPCASGSSSPPTARSKHSVIWTGSEMIVWGGCDLENGNACDLPDGGRYNPSANSWIATGTASESCTFPVTTGNVPVGRAGHTATWSGTEMIIFGGGNSDQSTDHGDLSSWGRYSPTLSKWACKPCNESGGICHNIPNIPAQRIRHTAVWSGSQMIAWGGNCALGDNGSCDSGVGDGQGDYDSGGLFSPGDSWLTTSIAPSPRSQHTAVWTGDYANPQSSDRMIVWGGNCTSITGGMACPASGVGPLRDGGRYTPGNGWSPTCDGVTNVCSDASTSPSARYGHTAVWTGNTANAEARNLMIVWGGCDNPSGCVTSGFLDIGGLYSQSPERWTPTVTGGFSSEARAFHTAVWTQNENMIVWGGRNTSGDLSNGGIYSPTGIFIVQQPQSIAVAPQTTYSLSVSAAGSGLTYQWQTGDGQNIVDHGPGEIGFTVTGSQTSTLTISQSGFHADCDGTGTYRVLISSPSCGGTIVSATATVTCVFP